MIAMSPQMCYNPFTGDLYTIKGFLTQGGPADDHMVKTLCLLYTYITNSIFNKLSQISLSQLK